jgi:hypothetical protein
MATAPATIPRANVAAVDAFAGFGNGASLRRVRAAAERAAVFLFAEPDDVRLRGLLVAAFLFAFLFVALVAFLPLPFFAVFLVVATLTSGCRSLISASSRITRC